MEQSGIDTDDIIRPIDQKNEGEVENEVKRLLRKNRGFKSNFTTACNILNKIINAASQGNNFDRSPDTMNAMRRARETLEIRFNKLERCYNRIMDSCC